MTCRKQLFSTCFTMSECASCQFRCIIEKQYTDTEKSGCRTKYFTLKSHFKSHLPSEHQIQTPTLKFTLI